MRLDNKAEVRIAEGKTLRYENQGLAVWTSYSGNGVDGNMAWFDYRHGCIVVKNPDDEILRKMWFIASKMGAKVQGDDGEIYDEGGHSPQPVRHTRPCWKKLFGR